MAHRILQAFLYLAAAFVISLAILFIAIAAVELFVFIQAYSLDLPKALVLIAIVTT